MATGKQSSRDGNTDPVPKSAASHPTSNFSGQIFGPGISDPATKDRAIATASYALKKERGAHNLSSDHIWMVLFTGVSCPKITNPAGAYSVVSWHGKQPRMAWYMPPASVSGVAVTEKRLAGLAIAQALYIADERLRGLPDDLKPKRVTIKVFSHCEETLSEINDPSMIKEKSDKRYSKKARLEVVKLIEDLSESLCSIVGIKTARVYLQWLPTSYPKMQCARDFAMKCRRKSGGKNLYIIGDKVHRVETMPESVYGFIEERVEDESEADVAEGLEGAEFAADDKQVSKVEVASEDEQAGRVDPEEGQVSIGQGWNLDDEKMDEKMDKGETTASERAPSYQLVSTEDYEQLKDNEKALEDEQSLVDQQLWADLGSR